MSRLALLPSILSIFIPFFTFHVYFIAVYYETVDPFVPYISDCAMSLPQASFFTISISLSVVLFIFFGLLRFFQIQTIVENELYFKSLNFSQKTREEICFYNFVSLVLGTVISFALLVIGSFRVNEMVLVGFHTIGALFGFHTIGAVFAFILLPFLFAIQTWISFKLVSKINTKFVAYFRLILTIVSVISLITLCIFTLWSYILFTKDWRRDRRQWKPEDGGYVQHMIAASVQWVFVVILIPLFAISFYSEFKRLKLIEVFKLEITLIDEMMTTNNN